MKYKKPNKLKIVNESANTQTIKSANTQTIKSANTQTKPISNRIPTRANFIKNLLKNNNNTKTIQVIQTKFKGEGKKGDFKWEIQEKIDPNTLYIYLDKEDDTLKRDKLIQKYNKDGIYPRSISISIKEEDKLTIPIKNKINKEIEKISDIISKGKYKKIKYNNFKDIDETVKDYIEYKIKNL